MKMFLYGFCSIMSTRVRLIALSETDNYLWGQLAGVAVVALISGATLAAVLLALCGW